MIVFPFSAGDRRQLVSLLHLLHDWGCITSSFNCLLACEEGLMTDEIKELAGKLFKSAGHLTVRAFSDQWPDAPNSYFAQVAEAISQSTSERWLWHEADLMPLHQNYLADIFADDAKEGKRFYGPVCGTYRRRDEAHPELGFNQVSEHLIGTSIYPADYFRSADGLYDENLEPVTPSLVRYLIANAQESRRFGQHVTPFDVFLEAETTPGAHRSTLIQHGWRSRHYRESNGRIEFDVDVNYGQDRFIRPGVVLQHGAKDDSLLRIVRRRAGLDGPAAEVQVQENRDGAVTARCAHNAEVEGLIPSPGTILSAQPGGAGASLAGAEEQKPASTSAPHPRPTAQQISQRYGFTDPLHEPVAVSHVRLGSNGGSVIFQDGSSQILSASQIVKARGRAAKPKRTAAEQAKIDLRMAQLRARKPSAKAKQQQAAREHR